MSTSVHDDQYLFLGDRDSPSDELLLAYAL